MSYSGEVFGKHFGSYFACKKCRCHLSRVSIWIVRFSKRHLAQTTKTVKLTVYVPAGQNQTYERSNSPVLENPVLMRRLMDISFHLLGCDYGPLPELSICLEVLQP